jgi:hypothetical protein
VLSGEENSMKEKSLTHIVVPIPCSEAKRKEKNNNPESSK